jgi:hypothetical protein
MQGLHGRDQQGRNRQQSEGRQGAEHEWEQQRNRQPPCSDVGPAATIGSQVGSDAFEPRTQRSAVAVRGDQHLHHRPNDLAIHADNSIERVGERHPQRVSPNRVTQRWADRRWGPSGHRRKRDRDGASRAHCNPEKVNDVREGISDLLLGEGGPSTTTPVLRTRYGSCHDQAEPWLDDQPGSNTSCDNSAQAPIGVGVRWPTCRAPQPPAKRRQRVR